MIAKFEAKRKGFYLTLPSYQKPGKVVDVINELLKGVIPIGYQLKTQEEHMELPGSLHAVLLAIMEGVSSMIRVYSIENQGTETGVIRSDSVKKGDNSWVFLNAYVLDCNEQALCIIGTDK